jgi:hypothetical protein
MDSFQEWDSIKLFKDLCGNRVLQICVTDVGHQVVAESGDLLSLFVSFLLMSQVPSMICQAPLWPTSGGMFCRYLLLGAPVMFLRGLLGASIMMSPCSLLCIRSVSFVCTNTDAC